jgi:hypothetical protein
LNNNRHCYVSAEKLAPLSLAENSKNIEDSSDDELIGPPVPTSLVENKDSESDSEVIGPMPPPPPQDSEVIGPLPPSDAGRSHDSDADSDDSDTEEVITFYITKNT